MLLPRIGPGHLADLLNQRRSTRAFAPASLSVDDLAALLWAGYGRRDDGGGIVPSAHALRPLSLIVVAGEVTGLPAGIYRYRPDQHDLRKLAAGDHREALAGATLADAGWLPRAAALIVITGDIETARDHFADQPPSGKRGPRYVWLEAGHASQNLYLAAVDRGLGAVLVAGFHDDQVTTALESPADSGTANPLGIVAIGRP